VLQRRFMQRLWMECVRFFWHVLRALMHPAVIEL